MVISSLVDFEDDLLWGFFVFLMAKDLCALSQTCKRFSDKCMTCAVGSTPPGCRTTPVEVGMWSVVDETARRWLSTMCSLQEQKWVPRLSSRGVESWTKMMHDVETLRCATRCFCRFSHNLFQLENGGAVVSRCQQPTNQNTQDYNIPSIAATGAVMRAGKHYVEFWILNTFPLYIGVMPARWNVEQGEIQETGGCFYFTPTGYRRSPLNRNTDYSDFEPWDGQQRAKKGDRVGLLLDSDKGTLTIFRNGYRLGDIADDLHDEYIWAVVLYKKSAVQINTVSLKHAIQESIYRELLVQLRSYEPWARNYANVVLVNRLQGYAERLQIPLCSDEQIVLMNEVETAKETQRLFLELGKHLTLNSQVLNLEEDFYVEKLEELRKIRDGIYAEIRRIETGM